MASQNRYPPTHLALLQQLQQQPYQFDFHQALRLIECLSPDRSRLGYAAKPTDDPVRLGQEPSLRFAPSTLASCQIEDHITLLKVYFFGVFGPNGPLPLHLTEFARNRIRQAKDQTFAAFADIFHHRMLSLFYRAWADKEPVVQLDRPEHDRFRFYIGSLAGIGEASQQRRDLIADQTKLYFAAHFGCHTRHAEGLQAILCDYLRVPVRIQELVGEWLKIPEDSVCFLNQDEHCGQLGVSSVIGARSWQCQYKFRLSVGPLTLKQYHRLLPGEKKLAQLHALVRNYVGFELNWDINLILQCDQVPAAKLGEDCRLGWTSWLQTGKRQTEGNDLFLSQERIA